MVGKNVLERLVGYGERSEQFCSDDPCGQSDSPSPPNALLGFILQEDGQCGQQLKTSPMILVIANMGIELLYQGRPGLHARAIRTTYHAPGHCCHEHEIPYAKNFARGRLPRRLDLERDHPRSLLMPFATIGTTTRLRVIVLLAFGYGAFTFLQYTRCSVPQCGEAGLA